METAIWHSNLILQFDSNLESNWLQNKRGSSLYIKGAGCKIFSITQNEGADCNIFSTPAACIIYQTCIIYIYSYIITSLHINSYIIHHYTLNWLLPSTLNSNAHQTCIITKLPSKAKNQQIWVLSLLKTKAKNQQIWIMEAESSQQWEDNYKIFNINDSFWYTTIITKYRTKST